MKFTIIIALTFLGVAAKAQVQNIKFDKEVHDFGTIVQNKPVNYSFSFTNADKKPVVIESATASCGCTTPDWTKTPVKPGKKGAVKAEFNAAALGTFEKIITITFHGNFVKEVKIKGNVVAKK